MSVIVGADAPEQGSAAGPTSPPEGWVDARLSDITERLASVRPEDEPDRVFGYVDISSIDNKTFQIVASKKFKGRDAPSRARRPIQPGDVLFSNVRTYLRNVAEVPEDLDAQLCSTGFTVLRSNGAVDPEFLFHWLLTDQFIDTVTPQQTGTHYPATTDAVVMAQSILLPPLAEQRRIASQVDNHISLIRKARARLSAAAELLKRFRQAVLAAACSGRLTEDWRTEHLDSEHAWVTLDRIRAERQRRGAISAGASRAGGSMEGRKDASRYEEGQPDLPLGWVWCRVDEFATVCLGGTPSRKEAAYWNGDIPWVSSGEVANCRIGRTRECITADGLANSNAKLYPPGTVLIAMIGEGRTRGQAALLDIKACTNQNVAGLVFDSGNVRSEYVWYWALGQYESNRSSGSGGMQPALNGQKVAAFEAALPPLAEQHEIVRRVEALFALADAIEQRITAATARVERLTQAVLAKAFRGELVPTEAELARREGRDYEPAAVLLERIRAERANGSSVREGADPGGNAL